MDWLVFCLAILTLAVMLLLIYCAVLTVRIDKEERQRKMDFVLLSGINMVEKLMANEKKKTTRKKSATKKSTKKGKK